MRRSFIAWYLNIKQFIKKSIYRKITLSFIFASLVPLLTLSFFSYIGYVSNIEAKTTQYNNQIMKFFSEKMEDYFIQIEQISSIVFQENVQTMIVNLDKKDSLEKLNILMSLNSIFLNQTYSHGFANKLKEIFILDADGSEVYKNSGYTFNKIDFSEYDWFKSFDKSEQSSTITLPHLKDYNNLSYGNQKNQGHSVADFSLTYIRSIGSTGSHNSHVGYIVIDFGLNELEAYIKPLRILESSEVTVIDRDDRIIFHKDLTLIGSKTDIYNKSMNNSIKGYDIKRENGKRHLISWYESSFTGWRIICDNDISEMTKDTAVIRKTSRILTAVTILLIVLISMFISAGFLKPINKLRKTMLKVHDGDLNASVSRLSEDEIGELGMVFNEMLEKIRYLVNEVYITQLREKQAQLDALQSQINPHFLYNTLENIRSIAYVEGVKDISQIVSALSNMFRYSIKLGGSYVKIYDEIAHVNDYIDIILVRYGDRIEVQKDIPDELMKYRIIKLILQPVLENAVFHGLEMKRGKGLLQIIARKLDEDIHISICDNGVGMDTETLDRIRESLESRKKDSLNNTGKGNSVGLKNVHDRIRLYHGNDYGIIIESKHDVGTQVEIRIPAIIFED